MSTRTDQDYFELIRGWIKKSRDVETYEYGHHPCAPHEEHQWDGCPIICECGHSCWDHIHLDGFNLKSSGPKPTAYICVGEPGCQCRMFVDVHPVSGGSVEP